MCTNYFFLKKFIFTYESFDSRQKENKWVVVVITGKNYCGVS